MARLSDHLKHMLGAGCTLVLLSACGGSDLDRVQRALEQQSRSQQTAAPQTAAPDETRIGTLAPRQLTAGTCGLFLWVRSSQRKLIFFAEATPGAGSMMFDNAPIQLTRTLADGASAFGHFARQEFVADGLDVRLDLTLDAREGMTDGVAVPQGSMRVEQSDGWQIVLPVGGLIACQRG